MRDLGNLTQSLQVLFRKKIMPKLVDAQRETAEQIRKDAISMLPKGYYLDGREAEYASSIKVGKTKVENGTITTSIGSNLLVGGDSKWAAVPIGAFVEWGTGIRGNATNEYPHGYPYTLHPWMYYSQVYQMYIKSIGRVASPHLHPALLKNTDTYKKNIRKVFKQ